jgi:aminopeptidase N
MAARAPRPRTRTAFTLLTTSLLLCEPAHVFSAGKEAASDPGVDAFAPPGTPAQYAPDRSLDIEHADIAVFPDLVEQRVTGVVRYRAKLLDPEAREITLDAVELEIDSASVNGTPAAVRREGDRIHVALAKTERDAASEAPGELELQIEWRAAPELGVYFLGPADARARSEALREGDTRPPRRGLPERRLALQAWTQGEMHETRHWLPTWDYPNDRFSTSWHVIAPAGMSVIANGEALGAEAIAAAKLAPSLTRAVAEAELDEAAVWHFEQREDHVSYLLSFIVGRFEVERDDWRGKAIEYWVPPGRAAEARATFAETPAMIEFYSEWIGLDFPWAKYAQTAVQEFTFGGMENVSATTMTDRILHPDALEPIADRQGLVAHELAHQWWGDLLTCREWAHIWLNEGFATYFSALWTEHAEGEDAFALSRRWMASSYFNEARRYRRPIVTREYRRAATMFDRHTYPKGGWVLHMLRRELGEADFRRAIAHYAEHNAFSLVETADLQRSIREVTGRNLDPFFEQWVFGSGHPELRSSWRFDADAKTVIIAVEQLQDRVFEFPLELELVGPAGLQARRVRVDRRSTQIVLAVEQAPDFVLVDAGMHLLAELDHEQREDQWRAQLGAAKRGIDRLRAAEALGHFAGPTVIAALREAANNDAFHGVRTAAAAALGKIGDEAATRALLELWAIETLALDTDPRVRRAILAGLARAHAPLGKDELELLRDALDDDDDDHVRAAAASALARFDGHTEPGADKHARKRADKLHAKAVKALRGALEQRSFNEEVEQAAVRALGSIANAKQLDVLLACVEPIRPTYLRIAAIDGLLRMRERPGVLEPEQRLEVAETIAALLDDPNMRIRRAVVDDIADLELTDVRARLSRAATHELDGRVRSLAEDELRSLE